VEILLCVAVAALVCTGLPTRAQDRVLRSALAQLNISFVEWTVPTKGSHPHDPLAAADGSIWYTGQMASTLGRLDPNTGTFKEYRTQTPACGPHGLVADEAGNIWFTANFAGYIGRLDPKTGAIIEYHLPDGARDPHTPIFDRAGDLWFTVMGADMIGRLVPQTGEIKLVRVPTADALPYGIAVNSQELCISPNSAPVSSRVLTRRRCRFANIRCPTRMVGRDASRSRATTRSGILTMRAAMWAGSIRKRAALVRGRRPVARTPALTESPRSETTFGIANLAQTPTRSCASIRRPKSSRPALFLPAQEWCAT